MTDLRLPADLAALRGLGPWLRTLLDADGLGAQHGRLELALHEVCVNVVEHAYGGADGTIDISGRVGPGEVELTVVDHGGGFDLATARRSAFGEPVERGFGLGIVEQLVDEVVYRRDEEGHNRWTLRLTR